jgi:NTE family protein
MRVAIACQGGGSHTAFTAGVLHRLLDADIFNTFDLTAISGTSGGAICSSMAWSGLVEGSPELSQQRLMGVWQDLIYQTPVEEFMMESWLQMMSLPFSFKVSPYMLPDLAYQSMEKLLKKWLPLDALSAEAIVKAPKLYIGSADVLSGERTVFTGDTLTHPRIIASAAIPSLFRAVEDRYWDGLYTTNPPIREFLAQEVRPDEIWVIRINPKARDSVPTCVTSIDDRHNELSGNLSLAQELFVVEKVNRLLESYPVLAERYQPVTVREIQMPLDLGTITKLRRSRDHIETLIETGRQSAEAFIESLGEPGETAILERAAA